MTTLDVPATRSRGPDERSACTAERRRTLVPCAQHTASTAPTRMVQPKWRLATPRRTITDVWRIVVCARADDPVALLNDELREELPFLAALTRKQRARVANLIEELAIDQHSERHCVYAYQRARIRFGNRQWYVRKLFLMLCHDGDDDSAFNDNFHITCACTVPARLFDAQNRPIVAQLHDPLTHPNMYECVNPQHMHVLPVRTKRSRLPPSQLTHQSSACALLAGRKRTRIPTTGALCDALLFEYVLMQASITGKHRRSDPSQTVGRLKRPTPLFVKNLRLRPRQRRPLLSPRLFATRPCTLEAARALRRRLFGD